MTTPLPTDAESIRTCAIESAKELALQIQALRRFYFGHHKIDPNLLTCFTHLQRLTALLDALQWPSTNAEEDFGPMPTEKPPLSSTQIDDMRHG